MSYLAIALALLVQTEAPQSTAAEAPRTAQTETRASRSNDPERMICRRENVIGSNRPVRTCRTAREWEEIREVSMQFHAASNRQEALVSNKGDGR